jgi:hypothetical protein
MGGDCYRRLGLDSVCSSIPDPPYAASIGDGDDDQHNGSDSANTNVGDSDQIVSYLINESCINPNAKLDGPHLRKCDADVWRPDIGELGIHIISRGVLSNVATSFWS